MKRVLPPLALAFLVALGAAGPARAGSWSVGVRIGAPYCFGGPCWGYHYYCYRPYPIYVPASPVIVERPVAVYQPVPVAPPAYQPAPASPPPATAPPPTPIPTVTPASATDVRSGDAQKYLQRLSDRDERVRADAALQLGRMRAQQAIDPLAATLAGDASPMAREAAARALGLIGSPQGLPALRRAAQLDGDRDVRHSAMFAVEVIQAR